MLLEVGVSAVTSAVVAVAVDRVRRRTADEVAVRSWTLDAMLRFQAAVAGVRTVAIKARDSTGDRASAMAIALAELNDAGEHLELVAEWKVSGFVWPLINEIEGAAERGDWDQDDVPAHVGNVEVLLACKRAMRKARTIVYPQHMRHRDLRRS